MTEELRTELWRQRRALTSRFIDSPEYFKLCPQCLSISYRNASVCHICAGYRFHNDPNAVRAIARVMATSPWPRTAGIVPRINYLSFPSLTLKPSRK